MHSPYSTWIGREQTQSDVLTPALLDRFRATIDSVDVGDTAPQGIHWCLCLPEAPTAGLGEDGHPLRGGFLPPIELPRRMWASSKVHFHAPINVGASVERRSTIASVEEKQGGSGTLIFVTIDHQTLVGGALAVSEVQTLVYRDAPTDKVVAPKNEGADISNWAWKRSLTPSQSLLFRFSALTFNTHRIHYDAPYAQDVEGYPALVVHGPLTATLLLDLAARNLGTNQLTTFEFRGMAPAFVGDALHLVGKQDAGHVALSALGGDGRVVMSAKASV